MNGTGETRSDIEEAPRKDASAAHGRRTLPIRWHLLVFAALVLLPQLVLGIGLGWWYSASEHERLRQTAVIAAASVSDQLDRELEAMKAALQALATSPNVREGDFAALREQALQLLTIRGSLIAVRDRNHQQVMNTLADVGAPLPVSVDPALVAADDRVFATGEPIVSDIYNGALTDERFVLVDVPLVVDGEVRYAMNMAISPTVILDILVRARLPDAWTATVIDGSGRVVARTRDHARFLGSAAPASFMESVGEARNGMVSNVTSLDGASLFVAFHTLDVSAWRVLIGVPHTALNAPYRVIVLTLATIILFTLATSIALARIYSRWLTREVTSLQDMASATGTGSPMVNRGGRVRELVAIAAALEEADASLKERNRHRDLLLAELNHRVRNTLSVLVSVVNQTIRGDGSEELAAKTSGRIMALSRAHDLLSHAEWSPIALSELVRKSGDQEQVAIRYDGPEIWMRAEAVAPMAQALHELAVNQRLHGQPADRAVALEVARDGDHVRLAWLLPEPGGPEQWRSGFGLRLVRLCLERQLFGRIDRFDATGLYATLPTSFLTGAGLPNEPFAARWRQRKAGGQ